MSTALVTGANRGIGLSIVRLLLGRGDRVHAACRRASSDLIAAGEDTPGELAVHEGVDVTDYASVAALDRALGDERLDLLVNNAGIAFWSSLDNLNFDHVRAQFEVNAVGPLRVTTALLHRLADPSRVAVITSRMGSIADNTSGGNYGYRMSKAAVNMAFASLAHDLAPRGVAVVILHPGFVKTDMTDGRGNWGPDEAAASLLARMDDAGPETTGRFLHADGTPLPW